MILQFFLYIVFYMKFSNMPKLSERLKYIRMMHNLSQAELAEHAGTTQQAIQQAEKGKARQPRYLHQLASSLDIPVQWMVLGEAQDSQDVFDEDAIAAGLNDKSSEVLDSFFAMPKKDQKLIYELMQSRKKK